VHQKRGIDHHLRHYERHDSMFIRWQEYRSVATWHQGEPPIKRVKAVLVESVRVNGKPRQKHVAFIASYNGRDEPNELRTRCIFWRWARKRLKELKLTPKQCRQIEVMLAKRIKPPTKRQTAAHERDTKALFASFKRIAA
jgi:hypothetical protein